MKREAPTNTKMRRLCRALNLRLYEACGLLELLWHITAREAPRGDIGKLSNEDIALALDFCGDEHRLIDVLVQTGWLDRDDHYRLLVHDWAEHCDKAVRKKLAYHDESFIKPFVATKPRNVERKDENLGVTRARAGPEPEPEPAPAPDTHQKPEPAPAPAPAPEMHARPNGALSSADADVGVCSGSKLKNEKDKGKNKRAAPEDAYVAYWNRHCGPTVGPVVDFTPELRRQLLARIRAGLTPEKFAEVLRKCLATPNLLGKGTMPSKWIVEFRYVVESDENIAKILNGGYGKEERRLPSTWQEQLSQNQRWMLDDGEEGSARRLAQQRDRAAQLEEPRRSNELSKVAKSEEEMKTFFAFVSRMKREESENKRADAEFLGHSEVSHANA